VSMAPRRAHLRHRRSRSPVAPGSEQRRDGAAPRAVPGPSHASRTGRAPRRATRAVQMPLRHCLRLARPSLPVIHDRRLTLVHAQCMRLKLGPRWRSHRRSERPDRVALSDVRWSPIAASSLDSPASSPSGSVSCWASPSVSEREFAGAGERWRACRPRPSPVRSAVRARATCRRETGATHRC
jgi:hypothetical protein